MALLRDLLSLRSNYYFFGLVSGFCFLFVLFSWQRLSKVMRAGKGESLLRKFLKVNLCFSVGLLAGVFVLALLFTISDSLYTYCVPILQLDLEVLNVVGFAIIRISFIWLVGSAFEIGRTCEAGTRNLTLTKIRRIEALSLTGVVLLVFGNFVFISSLASLLLFVFSLWVVYVCRKNFRKLDATRRRRQ